MPKSTDSSPEDSMKRVTGGSAATSPKSPAGMVALPYSFHPGDYDVICARGKPNEARFILLQMQLFITLARHQCIMSNMLVTSSFCLSRFLCVWPPGKAVKAHSGNRWFRSLVETHLQEYSECESKLEKSFVVSKVIKIVRKQSPNGGFVKNLDGSWYEVGDKIAR